MMEEATRIISQADVETLETILKAVLGRYGELFPEWEISVISLPKGDARNEQIDRIIDLFHKMKTSP